MISPPPYLRLSRCHETTSPESGFTTQPGPGSTSEVRDLNRRGARSDRDRAPPAAGIVGLASYNQRRNLSGDWVMPSE
jgi:hypothetical protein